MVMGVLLQVLWRNGRSVAWYLYGIDWVALAPFLGGADPVWIFRVNL